MILDVVAPSSEALAQWPIASGRTRDGTAVANGRPGAAIRR